MPKAVTLKVRARANRMIVDLEAMAAGARRFVGRQYDTDHPDRTPQAIAAADAKHVRIDEPTNYDHRPHWGRSAVVEKPARPEYMLAVRRGDLLAADELTAKLCGVKLSDHDALHKAEPEEDWEPDHKAAKAALAAPAAPASDKTKDASK